MGERPGKVIITSALAIIGGILTIASMAMYFDPGSEKVLAEVGLALLIAVLFFAVGGTLYRNGQSSWKSTVFLSFMNVAVIACDILYKTMDQYFGAVLLLIALFVALLAACPSTAKWIVTDRA